MFGLYRKLHCNNRTGYNIVDFKSHYNKTKISEMDISNIYLNNESFEIFA